MWWLIGISVVILIIIIIRARHMVSNTIKAPAPVAPAPVVPSAIVSAVQAPVQVPVEPPAYWLTAKVPSGFKDLGEIGIAGDDAQGYDFRRGGHIGDGLTWYHPRLCWGSFDPKIHTNILWGFGTTAGSAVGVIGEPGKRYPWTQGGMSPWGDWRWYYPLLESHPGAALHWDRNTGGQIGIIARGSLPFPRGGQLTDDWWFYHPRSV